MGFFSWVADSWFGDKISDACDFVKDKVEDVIIDVQIGFDWIRDSLSGKSYDEGKIEDQIDVDAVLEEYKENIKKEVSETESECMKKISDAFLELMTEISEQFSDLVEIIKEQQTKAEKELQGTIIEYIKEHLSKNDPEFLKVLKMRPGKEKEEELENIYKKIRSDAVIEFSEKLKKYIEDLLSEFTNRLDIRITDQEKEMNQRITELKKLQKEAEDGQIDIERLKNHSIPIIESAECIIHLLEMENR